MMTQMPQGFPWWCHALGSHAGKRIMRRCCDNRVAPLPRCAWMKRLPLVAKTRSMSELCPPVQQRFPLSALLLQ